jgi:phosphoribosylformimino-5-aminoimidazole carboxamide ribotide isomerase
MSERFDVIPAVDVLEGRVVRLAGGRRERVTIEAGDPQEVAARFAMEGAGRLHVVDLDGAFSGSPTPGLVERLAGAGIPIQVGGGFRHPQAVSDALAAGAERVIVGTAAVSEELLEGALEVAGDRLVVAVDVADGRVAVSGWVKTADVDPVELARRCRATGVARLLVTSTTRDGLLRGPDIELLERLVEVGLPVIAAGGVSSTDDLRVLRDIGCEGAVTGSALLTGRFTLAEARTALSSGR